MKKNIPAFKVINWNFNQDNIEYYDVMPYFVSCWKEEKKRKHKVWNLDVNGHKTDTNDTKMPETFKEFKAFILCWSQYNFWARCEYECVVSGWPVKRNEVKIDVHEQIEANIDIVTKLFMDYILG